VGNTVDEILAILTKLLPTLLEAVSHVHRTTGGSIEAAADEVADHLTPGKPDSPHLA
jgi:hypothetical protein